MKFLLIGSLGLILAACSSSGGHVVGNGMTSSKYAVASENSCGCNGKDGVCTGCGNEAHECACKPGAK